MSLRKVSIGIAVNLCRFAVALTFIFSGYVKAIDPLGTQYKACKTTLKCCICRRMCPIM